MRARLALLAVAVVAVAVFLAAAKLDPTGGTGWKWNGGDPKGGSTGLYVAEPGQVGGTGWSWNSTSVGGWEPLPYSL